ncbi:hypothetical protein MMC25_006567 [Agyrium rufum]|nr:hypothetical protein [Agyrium rufum]
MPPSNELVKEMASSFSFHEQTKRLRPDQSAKDSSCWVGVLKTHASRSGTKVSDDYLWFKAPPTIKAKKIHSIFKNNQNIKTEIMLNFEDRVLTDNETVGDLDIYRDHFIAIEAVEGIQRTLAAQTMGSPRKPFEPVTRQTLNSPTVSQRCMWHHGTAKSQRRISQYLLIIFLLSTPAPRFPSSHHMPGTPMSSFSSSRNPLLPRSLPNRMVNDTKTLTILLNISQQSDTNDSDSEDEINPAPDAEHAQRFNLQKIMADVSLEILEAGVKRGVKLLDDLKITLSEKVKDSEDAAQWITQIERLSKQAVKTKTIIGVVGNTGAGKSSVINAMLDEVRLVPTNTMRACTAVVTELSYNESRFAYCAEIEFFTSQEWEKELKTLFEDLLDPSGELSRDCTVEDSDAGIAYAKIKAVYPKKTRDDIKSSSIQQMLREVSHVLGTTRKINEDDSLKFYKKLQSYVDSKEKSTGKDNEKGKKKPPKEREVWPLIKVVRIFVKSDALATGAVIVDLPGVHDANAARVAVAETYMKQCTGLWIVAPIIRAVDDIAAKNLLSEGFKRQMKMDGGYGSVTFVSSKTNDISISEASDSLGLDDKHAPAWAEIDKHIKKQRAL